MTAARLDLTIEQGADFGQAFPITDPDVTAQELAGATAVLQLRTQAGDAAALLTLTTLNGGLVVDAAGRTVAAAVGWAVTEALLAGPGVYDLKLLTASGRHKRTHQGAFAVSPAVTLAEPPPVLPPPPGFGQFDFSTPVNSLIIAAAM